MTALLLLRNAGVTARGQDLGDATRTHRSSLGHRLKQWLRVTVLGPFFCRRTQEPGGFILRNSEGQILAQGLSEDRYHAALAGLAEVYADCDSLVGLKTHNDAKIGRMRHRDHANAVEAIIGERVTRARNAEKFSAESFEHSGPCDVTGAGIGAAGNGVPRSVAGGQFVPGRDHLFLVAASPCLLCGCRPCQPHRLAFADSAKAAGEKDGLWVPLCVSHLNQLCAFSDEETWWHVVGVDPIAAARTLQRKSFQALSPQKDFGKYTDFNDSRREAGNAENLGGRVDFLSAPGALGQNLARRPTPTVVPSSALIE